PQGAVGAQGAAGAQGPVGPQGATGASPWSLSGSNTFYNAGNVGVGDSTPASLFTVGSGDKFQVDATGNIFLTDQNATIRFPGTAGPNVPMIEMFATGTSNAD